MELPKQKYKRQQPSVKDPDRICTICNSPYIAVSTLQKTCSKVCRRKKDDASRVRFHKKNPEIRDVYYKNTINKNPNLHKERRLKERTEIIRLLGGRCFVDYCNVENPYHLHADYVPTMKGTGYRHPRHIRWIRDNINDFRLLCANHHYELTITGRIENTDIIQ